MLFGGESSALLDQTTRVQWSKVLVDLQAASPNKPYKPQCSGTVAVWSLFRLDNFWAAVRAQCGRDFERRAPKRNRKRLLKLLTVDDMFT